MWASTLLVWIWSLFAVLFGVTVGSFLNVVIYRLPRGLSIGKPLRSFCPACGHRIGAIGNIPVISFLRLRGRCRHCGGGISLHYPLVELATALLFLICLDILYLSGLRQGVRGNAGDTPILVAHCVLFAALLATAVMDLEYYCLDIRVTWAAAAVGWIAHTIWTPSWSRDWIRPSPPLSAMSLVAAVTLAATMLILWRVGVRRAPAEPEPPDDADTRADDADGARPGEPPAPDADDPTERAGDSTPEPDSGEPAKPDAECSVPGPGRPFWKPALLVWLAAAVVAAVLVMTVYPVGSDAESGLRIPRLATGIAALFIALVAVAGVSREADDDIVSAIEEERPRARRVAVRELALLLPTIALGMVAAWAASGSGPLAAWWGEWLSYSPTGGTWRPILGLSTGLYGWIIAGGIGWFARIGFTLLFGKEALGMGDVHILAAAGAVAGWPVVLMGFFIAAPLALVAVALFALRRRFRALQYGPWLALGILIAAALQDVWLDYLRIRPLLAGE